MRTSLALLTATFLLSTSAVAFAQGECPPGSWFCDQGQPAATQNDQNAPDNGDSGQAAPEAESNPKKEAEPPVVVYEPQGHDDGSKVIVVNRPEDIPPPPRRRFHRNPWGLNLRLEGVMMGSSSQENKNAGMGGIGLSFRYRPVPHFALDAGLDLFGGTDWAGNSRRETSLMFNGIIYFNPRDAVQVYTLGGIGFSGATVQVNSTANGVTSSDTEHWGYFGGQLGLGLEFRLTHHVSLDFDVLGFVRSRTDSQAQQQPEFTDPTTGQQTNTSGGGLLRGGITFYW
jgi:opacity protein-like surface antigen